MFEWINRRLHCISSYSQFSQNKYASDDEDDEMRAAVAAAAAEEEEADTAALLLHDMLSGILTLGALSRRDPLVSQACGDGSDPDDDDGDEFYEQRGGGVGVAGAAAFFAAAREPPPAFRIKLTAEEERRIMEVAVRANEASAEKKTLELPLLEKRPPRTTLEELLVATRAEFLAGDGTTGSEKRKTATVHMRKARKSDGGEEEEKTNRRQQKDILTPKMLMEKKKKIHPEMELEEKEKRRGENPMAAHVAPDEVLLQLRGPS